jgi:hypothetical protein
MVRVLLCLALLAACHAAKAPELRVLGLHDASSREVVFVQVTNPEDRPMRLTKLEYTFAAAGATVSTGEVPLQRDVPAGAAVVLEVPLEADPNRPLTLHGKLVAELDEMVREFQISAQIQPH